MLRSGNNTPGVSTSNILGLNLDGERILVVYGSPTGLVFERLAVPTPNLESAATVLELITLQVDKLLNLTKAQRLPVPDRLSVAISGSYDCETGMLSSAPDFPNWKAVPLRSQLALRFNLPVYIEQKANAGALAEHYFGSAQNIRNLVFVSMTPTLKVGILVDGKLYRNPAGTAGQIGRIAMNLSQTDGQAASSTFDDFCSSHGMLQLARLRHPNHWEDGVELPKIIEDAVAGDPFALEVFAESGRYLGRGLSFVNHILRPEMIVIGYPGCLLEEALILPARKTLLQANNMDETILPKLVTSQLCTKLPELEALSAAIHANHIKA